MGRQSQGRGQTGAGGRSTKSPAPAGEGLSSKHLLWFALSACVLVALAFVAFGRGEGEAKAPGEAAPSPAPARTGAEAARGGAPAPTSVAGGAGDGAPPDEGFDPSAQHPVDLERLRSKLPDNSYWRLGAPTKDPAVLRAREDDERRRNDLYGKVLSNTATEEEIRSYYAERRKISEDYIEFAAAALKEYSDQLPEQERGLYELSIKMHKKRLLEVPGQIDDALARKKVQDRRREDWRQGPAE